MYIDELVEVDALDENVVMDEVAEYIDEEDDELIEIEEMLLAVNDEGDEVEYVAIDDDDDDD